MKTGKGIRRREREAIDLPRDAEARPLPPRPHCYRISLRISPADREDAWELCRVATDYGGEEVSQCCFVFPDEERWSIALDTLRLRFGAGYFEAEQCSGDLA